MEALARPHLSVVVTGSECTGKTTLALEIAARFGESASAEYVRGYLDRKGSPLDRSDVEPIALGQVHAEDVAASRARRLVVKDTDLVSTVVYARHYYGSCPAWIERAARERVADLYLLLCPDVPWLDDGQRDRGDRRHEMHGLFRETLTDLGARVVEIGGTWAERRAQAFAAVDSLVALGND